MRRQFLIQGDFEQRFLVGIQIRRIFANCLSEAATANLTGGASAIRGDFHPGAVLGRRENTSEAPGVLIDAATRCHPRHDDIIANAQVAIHHRRATQHAASADDCAASNANATGNRGCDRRYGSWSNLYEIVYLDPIANDRIVDRAPVNGGVGTDLVVADDDNPTCCKSLLPAPTCRLKAAIGTTATVIMQRSPILSGTNAHTRMDDAISTDDNIVKMLQWLATEVPAPTRDPRPLLAISDQSWR